MSQINKHPQPHGRQKPRLFIETDFESEEQAIAVSNKYLNANIAQEQPPEDELLLGDEATSIPYLFSGSNPSHHTLQSNYYNISNDSTVQLYKTVREFKDAISRENSMGHEEKYSSNAMRSQDQIPQLRLEDSVKLETQYPNKHPEIGQTHHSKFINHDNQQQNIYRSKQGRLNTGSEMAESDYQRLVSAHNLKRVKTESLRKDAFAINSLHVFYTLFYRRMASQFFHSLRTMGREQPIRSRVLSNRGVDNNSKSIIAQLSQTLSRIKSNRNQFTMNRNQSLFDLHKSGTTFQKKHDRSVQNLRQGIGSRFSSPDREHSTERAKILSGIVQKLKHAKIVNQQSRILEDSHYQQKKKAIKMDSRLDRIELMLKQIRKVHQASTMYSVKSKTLVLKKNNNNNSSSRITLNNKSRDLSRSREFQPHDTSREAQRSAHKKGMAMTDRVLRLSGSSRSGLTVIKDHLHHLGQPYSTQQQQPLFEPRDNNHKASETKNPAPPVYSFHDRNNQVSSPVALQNLNITSIQEDHSNTSYPKNPQPIQNPMHGSTNDNSSLKTALSPPQPSIASLINNQLSQASEIKKQPLPNFGNQLHYNIILNKPPQKTVQLESNSYTSGYQVRHNHFSEISGMKMPQPTKYITLNTTMPRRVTQEMNIYYPNTSSSNWRNLGPNVNTRKCAYCGHGCVQCRPISETVPNSQLQGQAQFYRPKYI